VEFEAGGGLFLVRYLVFMDGMDEMVDMVSVGWQCAS
jgi:hypothetical protein